MNDQKGARFLVEVAELAETRGGGAIQLTSGGSATGRKNLVEATDQVLALVKDAVADVCRVAVGAFQEANRPDEIVVKFGVKLGARAGAAVVFVTEATGEATLSFEAKWTNAKPPAAGPTRPQ